MNTFFISPLIPLKFYIVIQKEKNNISWDQDETNFISNINQLYDYSIIYYFYVKVKNIMTTIIK